MILRFITALAFLVLAAACTPRERTAILGKIDSEQGYRHHNLEAQSPKKLSRAFIAMTFSGGGTRAAALSYGALQALSQTTIPLADGEVVLADEIDIISSVSGGSATAAMFGLRGRAGMPEFKRSFLKHNVQGDLISHAINPITWFRLATPAYARIDALSDYFDDNLYAGSTFQDFLRYAPGESRRPYVVLNAADMATGSVFSFTQDQFDLLCADLAQFKIADAVAASAAFPIALTALTLKNRAPCDAQISAVSDRFSGWKSAEGRPRPQRVINDLDSRENPGRFRRGRNALTYLNEAKHKEYIHLLDGGIADNLGLTEPITLLISSDRSPSINSRINRGEVDDLGIIVVNARSDSETSFGRKATPPGVLTTLGAVIGTPIDSTSFLLIDRLDDLIRPQKNLRQTKVMVDFDYIDDLKCQTAFKELATSWALNENQVDALIALGDAMVRTSSNYRKMVSNLGGRIAENGPTIEAACSLLTGHSVSPN